MSSQTSHVYEHSDLSDLEITALSRGGSRKGYIALTQPIDTPRGRYDGKPYTWLSESEEPRSIAASLQQTESNDLGIHLYNVQRVKRLAHGDEDERRIKPYFRKHRQTSQEGPKAWTPRTYWTAWPLKSNMVPLGGEREKRWLIDPYVGQGVKGPPQRVQKPTANLEDCLLGEILSQSRKSFYAKRNEHRMNRGTGPNTTMSGTLRPEIMTDEERARQLSKPIIRNFIGQMESLLQALHTSRSGHTRARSSVSGTDVSSSAESDKSGSRSRSSRRKYRSNDSDPLPRDWSEVLSIAGMTGWNANALRRTAARCSSLFDEPLDRLMTFEATLTKSALSELTVDAQEEFDTKDTPSEGSRELSMRALCCPYRKCRLHSKPFKVRWRLNEHLRRTHKEETTSRSRSSSRSLEAEYGHEEEKSNYADDFLKPTVLSVRSKARKLQNKREGQSKPGKADRQVPDATTTYTSSDESSASSEDDQSDSSESGDAQESLKSRSTGSLSGLLSESDQSSRGSTAADDDVSSDVSSST